MSYAQTPTSDGDGDLILDGPIEKTDQDNNLADRAVNPKEVSDTLSIFPLGSTGATEGTLLAQTFTSGAAGVIKAIRIPADCGSGQIDIRLVPVLAEAEYDTAVDDGAGGKVKIKLKLPNLDPAQQLDSAALTTFSVATFKTNFPTFTLAGGTHTTYVGEELAFVLSVKNGSEDCVIALHEGGSSDDYSAGEHYQAENGGATWSAVSWVDPGAGATDNADLPFFTVVSVVDNCPGVSNPEQTDDDGDGDGDSCEAEGDLDTDSVLNNIDNCVATPNPLQTNRYGATTAGVACRIIAGDDSCLLDRREGDACDHSDDDEILDSEDNCPLIDNPKVMIEGVLKQPDGDGDGIGDACDLNDHDGDGVYNELKLDQNVALASGAFPIRLNLRQAQTFTSNANGLLEEVGLVLNCTAPTDVTLRLLKLVGATPNVAEEVDTVTRNVGTLTTNQLQVTTFALGDYDPATDQTTGAHTTSVGERLAIVVSVPAGSSCTWRHAGIISSAYAGGDAFEFAPGDTEWRLRGNNADLAFATYVRQNDNCPFHRNPEQEDEDNDGVGDACPKIESESGFCFPVMGENATAVICL